MLEIAEATGDADLLIVGHALACVCYCYAGKFIKSVEHADKVLDLYDDDEHFHLADILNQDPETSAGIFGSISTWILGYPDGHCGSTMKKTNTPAGAVAPLTSDLR